MRADSGVVDSPGGGDTADTGATSGAGGGAGALAGRGVAAASVRTLGCGPRPTAVAGCELVPSRCSKAAWYAVVVAQPREEVARPACHTRVASECFCRAANASPAQAARTHEKRSEARRRECTAGQGNAPFSTYARKQSEWTRRASSQSAVHLRSNSNSGKCGRSARPKGAQARHQTMQQTYTVGVVYCCSLS